MTKSLHRCVVRWCPRSAAARAILAAGLSVCGPACLAQSDASPTDRLRFSGFGTVGVVHANAPEGWSYRREISQVGSSRSTRADVDTRLGLQLNYAATPQIEFVGQLLVTRHSPYAPLSDGIEWAFAAFRALPDWTLRVGRVNLDQFLISDYRNVGFAYAYVRPPVDFYGSIPSRLDGGDLTRAWDMGNARWCLKGFVGRARIGDLNYDSNTLVKSTYGLMVSRDADGLLLRAGLSHINIGDLPPSAQLLYDAMGPLLALPVPSIATEAAALRQRLDYAHTGVTYAALAVSYESNQWQFTAEASRVKGHPLVGFDAAYASVARHFGPVTGFGVVSRIRSSGSHVAMPDWAATLTPVLGDAYARQVQYLGTVAADTVNKALPDQRTYSLGARWDMRSQLALKLQWDHVVTGEYGGRLWANPTDAAAHSNVTSVTLDFVF